MQISFLVCMFLFSTLKIADAESWHLHNSTEYYESNIVASIENANSRCANMNGAEMVMIQTKDVQCFLERLFANDDYLLGGY